LFFDVFGTRKCITEVKELKDHFAKIIQVHKETLDENDARDFIDAYLIEWQKNTQEEDNTQFTGKYKAKSSKVRQSAVRTPFMARCTRYNIL
jgi:TPP-dependent 2-oxoacid decarboxylase